MKVKLCNDAACYYDLTIVTGVWRDAGTIANVFLTVYGTEDVVEAINIIKYFPPGRKIFGRGSVSNFIL